MADGGTAHWFWNQDRDGRAVIRRDFIDRPFPDYAADQLQDIPVPDTPLPTPVGDRPVCIQGVPITTEPEEDGVAEVEIQRLCGFASGEVWHIQGWWPQGDEPEQVRVESLLDGLESTLR